MLRYVILCYPPRLGKLDLESGGAVAAVCLEEGLCVNLGLKQHMRQKYVRVMYSISIKMAVEDTAGNNMEQLIILETVGEQLGPFENIG